MHTSTPVPSPCVVTSFIRLPVSHRLKKLNQMLDEQTGIYWDNFRISYGLQTTKDIESFWTELGYTGIGWASRPATTLSAVSRRATGRKSWFRCETCQQWKAMDRAVELGEGDRVCALYAPRSEELDCTPLPVGMAAPLPSDTFVPLGAPAPKRAATSTPTHERAGAAVAEPPVTVKKESGAGERRQQGDHVDKTQMDVSLVGTTLASGNESMVKAEPTYPTDPRRRHKKPSQTPHLEATNHPAARDASPSPTNHHDPRLTRRDMPVPVVEETTETAPEQPPTAKRHKDSITSSMTPEDMEAALVRCVFDVVNRITPPDLLPDVKSVDKHFVVTTMLPRLAEEYTVFLASCIAETDQEVRWGIGALCFVFVVTCCHVRAVLCGDVL